MYGFISAMEKASFVNLNAFKFETDPTCFVCSAPLVLSAFSGLLHWEETTRSINMHSIFDVSFSTRLKNMLK